MAIRANVHELPQIAQFCRERTRDYFRFDPFLHLRFDGDPRRNEEIKAQRLAPEEIVALERADPERWVALKKECDKLAAESPERQAKFFEGTFGELNDAWKAADKDEARAVADRWEKTAVLVAGVARETLEQSGGMYLAEKAVMKNHGANAITINCLGGFYGGHIHAYPCLGFHQLLNEGGGRLRVRRPLRRHHADRHNPGARGGRATSRTRSSTPRSGRSSMRIVWRPTARLVRKAQPTRLRY